MRPVVAVVAVAPRVGTTTVARALAVELAERDPAGAAAVAGAVRAGPLALAAGAAGALARAIGTAGGRRLRPAGRLCLVEGGELRPLVDASRPFAPLVVDVPHGHPTGVPASLADHVALVASPDVEPALASVVAASLARIGPRPLVVLNRAREGGSGELERWTGRPDVAIAESRPGARLALAGRNPRGALGPGLRELGEACAEAAGEW